VIAFLRPRHDSETIWILEKAMFDATSPPYNSDLLAMLVNVGRRYIDAFLGSKLMRQKLGRGVFVLFKCLDIIS
jgi:hypothetical protein